MKSIVIIHGIGGLSREGYFPHLKHKCEKLGLKVFMPSLGGYREHITYDQWKKHCDENILPNIVPEETIFVGQSVGTNFLVKYMVERNLNAKAYVSCAAPYDVLEIIPTAPERAFSFAPVSKLFKPTKKDFDSFRAKKFPKYSLFCDNDTFFSQQNLEKYSSAIQSTPMLISGGGHFTADKLPELEKLIEKLNKM